MMVFSGRIDWRTATEESSSRYCISDKNTSANELSQGIRCHWQIENNLHWLIDEAFAEE